MQTQNNRKVYKMKYVLCLSLLLMYIGITRDLWVDMFDKIKARIEEKKKEKEK